MIRRNLHAGGGNGAKGWCERRGLNSQGLLRWILNPVRMPVSPLSHERAIYCKAMNLTQLCAVGKRKSARPGPAARRFCASERRWGSPSAPSCGGSFLSSGREVSAGSKRGRSRCRSAPVRERRKGRFFRGVRKKRAASKLRGAAGRSERPKAGCKEKRKESCAFGSAPACRAGTPVKERPRAGQGLCPHAA